MGIIKGSVGQRGIGNNESINHCISHFGLCMGLCSLRYASIPHKIKTRKEGRFKAV